MNKFFYDYIIIGQGLAGSVLSSMLINDNKNVLVIDHYYPGSSSQVAAGLVNPVTGRRVVKSWMADTLLPIASDFYTNSEKLLGDNFYFPMDVLEVVNNVKDLNEWTSRMSESEMKIYLNEDSPEELYRGKIGEFKKMIRITSSAWMNIPKYIGLVRKFLINNSSLLDQTFDYSKFSIDDQIHYGNIDSPKIIFCEGFGSLKNPFWSWIPLVPAKGEILTIECQGLPEKYILLNGFFLIPLGNHCFRAGSTFEWNFPHELPTEEGKQKLIKLLNDFLKIPYTIVDHRAGIRPTVKDRRPLIGHHPDHKNVFIFNGMGTKGVQLIPFFADHFLKYLNGKIPLMDEVNVNRFKK